MSDGPSRDGHSCRCACQRAGPPVLSPAVDPELDVHSVRRPQASGVLAQERERGGARRSGRASNTELDLLPKFTLWVYLLTLIHNKDAQAGCIDVSNNQSGLLMSPKARPTRDARQGPECPLDGLNCKGVCKSCHAHFNYAYRFQHVCANVFNTSLPKKMHNYA